MTEVLGVLGVAALFVVFGLAYGRRHQADRGGCGCRRDEGCGACQVEDRRGG